mgnify:CR=1 FL=1
MRPKIMQHDQFCALIAKLCETNPFHFEGRDWLAGGRQELAYMLGVSEATLGRYIKVAPIVRKRAASMVLLRVGEPDPLTHREIGNLMAKAYRKHSGREVSPRGAGCLYALAAEWPEGEQVNIFRHVLVHWDQYMSYVGCLIEDMNAFAGATVLRKRHLKKPSIATIRLFEMAATELYRDYLQFAVKPSDAYGVLSGSSCPLQ